MAGELREARPHWLDVSKKRWSAVLFGAFVLAVWGFGFNEGKWTFDAFAVGVVLFGPLLAFVTFTWRRLRHGRRTEANGLVYDTGVSRFGVGMGVFLTITLAYDRFWPPRSWTLPDVSDFLFRVTILALCQIPFALWAGYAWGRFMGMLVQTPPNEWSAPRRPTALGVDERAEVAASPLWL